MNFWDGIFWVWFAMSGLLLIFFMLDDYSPASLLLSLNIIGFGLIKLSQEQPRKVSRELLEKLKSI
jgi:hypothetical protein